MEQIIKQCRAQILELWQLLRISQEERKEFSAFFVDTFTQEVLDIHEEKIRELSILWEDMQPIIDMISQREAILERKKEFESTTADPNRLLSKAPRDPGRLLKEERERKMFTKTLPKLESKLIQAIKDWEKDRNQPFVINGQRYIETLQATVSTLDTRRATPLKPAESPRRTPVADRHFSSTPLSPFNSSIVNIHNIPIATPNNNKTPRSKRPPEGKENATSKVPRL
jgi:protein regulator of cytokinesis 1